MSSSSAVKLESEINLEQSLLDASAKAEYIGRRPSSSGRETKRISTLQTCPLPFAGPAQQKLCAPLPAAIS